MAFFGLTTNKKKKAEKKKVKNLRQENERLRNVEGPDRASLQQQAYKEAQNMQNIGEEGIARGKKRGEEFLSREFKGLNPEQEQRYQSQANRRINREVEGAQRELIGKQGHRGMKGGQAFAQRAHLANQGNELRGEASDKIRNLDSDLALKKMASQFAIEEGERAQSILNNQSALDQLLLDEERKKQRRAQQQFNGNFSRI
jgi:hypothetical protein